MKLAVALTILALAPCYGGKAWLDGRVVAIGHVQNGLGDSIPTATVIMYDPGNADPNAQKEVWVITFDASTYGMTKKAKVDLSKGTTFKAYRAGQTSQNYGFLAVRYLDKKNREQAEEHQIVQALGIGDVRE